MKFSPSLLPFALASCAALGPPGPPLLARSVEVGPDDVVEVRTRLRFATAVVLPAGETILDWICGDAEYWSVQGSANLTFVKPSAEAGRTNVTLVTDQGRIYTLLVRELGSEDGDPDLKVVLLPRTPEAEAEAAGLPPLRFASQETVRDAARQAALAREEAREARLDAERQVAADRAAFRAEYPARLRFAYELERHAAARPFRVRAMWRDDRFTYIAADPEEAPALYESRDGAPSLAPYDFADGLYVARRPLGDGWLQIGKRKLRFRYLERNPEASR